MLENAFNCIRVLKINEDGATAIEYALIAALIAGGLAAGIGTLADGINIVYSHIVDNT
jgi:Flp pilus assembly pilin Flp